MLLGKCEFGREDYSLNIISMPRDENEPDKQANPMAKIPLKWIALTLGFSAITVRLKNRFDATIRGVDRNRTLLFRT